MTTIQATAPDGHTLSALVEGSGPDLLVVPPGDGDVTTWGEVTRALAGSFRPVRLQRRIYEPEASIRLPHTMAGEATDIVALTETLATPVIGVGHSSGAVALLEAALVRPDLFRQLILYEPPLPTTSLVGGEQGRAARRALDDGDPETAMRIHLEDIVGLPPHIVDEMWQGPEAVRRLTANAAGQIADNEAIDDLAIGVDRYRALDLPVVLIEGDKSPPHLRQRLADLGAALPRVCAVRTLVGQGHVAHLAAPEELAHVIMTSSPG
ncbi:MAG: alpha/beta fold hydrolase [Nocardioidaceae bacterium]